MSGFAADWLALRAPADMAARNAGLLSALGDWAAERGRLSILDLGSGTGATLRALAPRLPCEQHWLLVDKDPALLAACPESRPEVEVATACLDLAADLEMLPWTAVDLVTGSALLDLVSTTWLERLAALCDRAAVYLALSVDGRVGFEPPLAEDGRVLDLLAAHHRRDKSFGPALGHDAAEVAAELLRARGRAVRLARADWDLGPEQAALQAALLDGYASAAIEQAPAAGETLLAWREARRGLAAQRIRVGHLDLLSLPG